MAKNKSEKVPLIYQDLVEEITYESLPSSWIDHNLSSFSDKITLFDYQQEALKSAIKFLHYYFESLQKYHTQENQQEYIERKKKLYNEISKFNKKLIDSLGIINKNKKLLFNRLKEYYPIIEENSYEKIHFHNFVNRMSFWMATGSGKTIDLIKLIEILDKLITSKLIPENDILILTHRDDLIDQIKEHIDEYNKMRSRRIKLWDLRRYADVKTGNVLTFKDEINVFIYRSDLISDQTKEKLLSFDDIENNGKWYLLLDEAHKGDKEDSKRQLYYSVLTRNGFLFNFSATFTDVWDIITTVYNFNLDRFIEKGYGKNVYLSQQELNAFKDKEDFYDVSKQKIVLKALILLTVVKRAKNNIDKKLGINKHYHNPLMIALVNSVHTEKADLEIFFKQLELIASGKIDSDIFENAKEELIKEFLEHPRYVFGHDELLVNEEVINTIGVTDVLEQVFNAPSFGGIEVIKIPKNNEELIFKLKTTEKPFALMKIGDAGKWVKEKLTNYEINESYENTSYFRIINQKNCPANILMGSRAFYEGWDSNRPNVMIFINIGMGDAKKYVTQSIGRGVRIEPIKDKRKRLIPLKRENDITAKEIYSKLDEEDISLIETLFVLGTNKDNVQKILESIKYERKKYGEIIELKENELSKKYTLLIPVYKDVEEILSVETLPKFEGNKELISNFIEWLEDDRLLYPIFAEENHIEPKTITKIKDFLDKGGFKRSNTGYIYTQISKLLRHVNITMQDLKKFKALEDEIVHFKRIRVSLETNEIEKLKELIEKVKGYKDAKIEKEKYKELLKSEKIDIDEFTAKIEELSRTSNEEDFKDLKIKHIVNHYYLPVILSTKEKISYINHIINVKSERKFVMELEKQVRENGFFNDFDWWMFSKLDAHLDEVYIPYYNKDNNRIEKFKPDFIFWLEKGDIYYIIFADPKGTKHTDYECKVDGYRFIFEDGQDRKTFTKDGLKVQVHLRLYTEDKNKLSERHKAYWFDNPKDIVGDINVS